MNIYFKIIIIYCGSFPVVSGKIFLNISYLKDMKFWPWRIVKFVLL